MDKYLITLTYLPGLGPKTLLKLLELFGSAEAIYTASYSEFKNKKVPDKISELILSQRRQFNPDKIINQLEKENIKTVTLFDDGYPLLLKEIYAPPIVLYYRGNLQLLQNDKILAVVGSRKFSAYIKTVLPLLLKEIIAAGVPIVSGLAYGVDELAHRLCVEANSPTAAVTGSGLAWDYLYPKGNIKLAQQIINRGGVLISEFPPFTKAHPTSFPRRNRIIAGLSRATLVAEAAGKSGALITAAYALEQGREVLAVPQNIINENAAGTNGLIAKGAKLISNSEDIIEALNLPAINGQITNKYKPDLSNLSENELLIYKILPDSPVHIDKIIEHCTLDTSLVNAVLIQLEINGLAKNIGNQNYLKL